MLSYCEVMLETFQNNLVTSVKGLRGQMDRSLYKKHMQDVIFNYKNLTVQYDTVADILLDTSQETIGATKVKHAVRGVLLGKLMLPVWT